MLDRKAVGTSDLLGVFARAFLLQACWSYERMQSLGFAYAIEPVLKKLYPDRTEYESRLRLHLDYFNTQPYLALFILGAAVRLEEDRATGRADAGDVQGLKSSLAAPLGALGDSFFWGSLKPVAAITAAALIMTGIWWAPLAYLALYNAGHIGLRAAVLFRGYRTRGDAMDLLTRFHFTAGANMLKTITLTVLGGVLGSMPFWNYGFGPVMTLPPSITAVLGMAFMLMATFVLRKGVTPIQCMLGLAIACLAIAFSGAIG